jgi:hypothetical protein
MPEGHEDDLDRRVFDISAKLSVFSHQLDGLRDLHDYQGLPASCKP